MALADVCGSTAEKGGVAGAEFSADVSFSQGSFREFRPFSVIAENHWPYVCMCVCVLCVSVLCVCVSTVEQGGRGRSGVQHRRDIFSVVLFFN